MASESKVSLSNIFPMVSDRMRDYCVAVPGTQAQVERTIARYTALMDRFERRMSRLASDRRN